MPERLEALVHRWLGAWRHSAHLVAHLYQGDALLFVSITLQLFCTSMCKRIQKSEPRAGDDARTRDPHLGKICRGFEFKMTEFRGENSTLPIVVFGWS